MFDKIDISRVTTYDEICISRCENFYEIAVILIFFDTFILICDSWYRMQYYNYLQI